ncbi:hypothetical protein HII13_004733 [Brettanomyces bruxellensis]|uniref:DEBR0S5_02520g1_1 n=1 Tax=Dekkera bruxellensis TaxID=5007 RepID=A0A7D9H3A8_DEKBR|nr:uncharacterized protein BRETT_000123 [Brettanomyces bruxellensis]KAF6007056.1 hypothetical protein HII13_004733 [Brettanomyces bruxellensis]KAF6010234.1 hypothetical protein HII12_002941 [Brettanomyces bruxellensis]QOU18396.1 hypothetical protein BRETT_000123 [Brettanomyces bruxellensis]VUG19428.1 DEBR0S5_02520g1_1 [Brettanomyces bruxellensis]
MGYSARSKPKLRAKAAKVAAKGSDYSRTEKERIKRIAEKGIENLEKQKKEKEHDGGMDTDTVADLKSKISTSGWRKTRSAQSKRRKALKKHRKTLKF